MPGPGFAIHELRDTLPVMVVDKDIGQRQTRPIHDPEPMRVIGSVGGAALPSVAL